MEFSKHAWYLSITALINFCDIQGSDPTDGLLERFCFHEQKSSEGFLCLSTFFEVNSSKQLCSSVRPLVEAPLLHIGPCVLGLGACIVLELKLHLHRYVFRTQILQQVETSLAACASYLAKVLISLLTLQQKGPLIPTACWEPFLIVIKLSCSFKQIRLN